MQSAHMPFPSSSGAHTAEEPCEARGCVRRTAVTMAAYSRFASSGSIGTLGL